MDNYPPININPLTQLYRDLSEIICNSESDARKVPKILQEYETKNKANRVLSDFIFIESEITRYFPVDMSMHSKNILETVFHTPERAQIMQKYIQTRLEMDKEPWNAAEQVHHGARHNDEGHGEIEDDDIDFLLDFRRPVLQQGSDEVVESAPQQEEEGELLQEIEPQPLPDTKLFHERPDHRVPLILDSKSFLRDEDGCHDHVEACQPDIHDDPIAHCREVHTRFTFHKYFGNYKWVEFTLYNLLDRDRGDRFFRNEKLLYSSLPYKK